MVDGGRPVGCGPLRVGAGGVCRPGLAARAAFAICAMTMPTKTTTEIIISVESARTILRGVSIRRNPFRLSRTGHAGAARS